VVWSDEEEDPECPLCMEELDPSDVHFKPCVCGYQVSSANIESPIGVG
jgi:CCR4-NOT transcription complex subunit 4